MTYFSRPKSALPGVATTWLQHVRRHQCSKRFSRSLCFCSRCRSASSPPPTRPNPPPRLPSPQPTPPRSTPSNPLPPPSRRLAKCMATTAPCVTAPPATAKATSPRARPSRTTPTPPSLRDLTDGQLFYIIQNGRGQMPGEAGRQNDQEIWNMVILVRSFSHK